MHAPVGSARPVVVLIASEQEWASRSLESILTPRGYVVVKTYSRRQAIEGALRDAPDAILIDVRLPDGDGHALCRELRARDLVSASTPILIIAPRAPTRADRLMALRAGAWECLGAPPDTDELIALLEAFVPAKLDADEARTRGLVDETTGLYNVRGLTRRAHELGAHAARHSAALACVLLAPDPGSEDAEGPFGAVHTLVLQRVARSLNSTPRRSDVVGHLGPAAFAVVAADTDAGQARALAQRLADAVLAAPRVGVESAPPLRLHGGCHGVSDFRTASIDTVELMLRATAALQKARSDPAGGWLRGFDEVDQPAPS